MKVARNYWTAGWTTVLLLMAISLQGTAIKNGRAMSAQSRTAQAIDLKTEGQGHRAASNHLSEAIRTTAPIDVHDLLTLHFDASFTGEQGEMPTQSSGVTFVSGINGQGVQVDGGDVLRYATAGNFNAHAGSIEFWIKPLWNGSDTTTRYFFSVGNNQLLLVKDGANNFRFFLKQDDSEAFQGYNLGSWIANQWHHVAVTWSLPGRMKTYFDGTLVIDHAASNQDLISPIPADLFFGGNNGASPPTAVIDEFYLSDVPRSAQEIASRMVAGLTVNSWALNPATTTIELWPTWYWWINPTLTANTNIGVLTLPVLAASWSTSDPTVATMEIGSGRIKALSPGNTILTGTISGQQRSIAINVVAPVRPPEEEIIAPFLATPAASSLYKIPVAIINFLPTRDGINIDAVASGWSGTVATMKNNLSNYRTQMKYQIEERSKFRRYSDPSAQPALGYQVVKIIDVYEDIPPWYRGVPFQPDYYTILTRFNAESWVNSLGVKEVWMWGYHYGRIGPVESDMASPTTSDISNSYRYNDDLPIFDHTYVLYNFNFARGDVHMHNQGHQLEAIFSYVSARQDGNDNLFWNNFCGRNPDGSFQQGRCGNTHFPPNGTADYDYSNPTPVLSDIEDWTPARIGQLKQTNVFSWRNLFFAWPNNVPPDDIDQAKYLLYWMQSMPGRSNTIPYNSYKMTNWWHFTGDWDAAITAGIGLYEPGSCSYSLSSLNQSFNIGGGTCTVNITCNGGCKWLASSNETWITITAGRTGNGNGTVGLSIAANPASPRTGTVAIAGEVFTVTQNGSCSFSINPPSQSFPFAGGTGSINMTTASGCTWTAQSNDSWIALANFGGTGNGSVGFTVAANSGGQRTGTATIAGQTFTVTQNAFSCPTININPASLSIGFIGTAYNQSLMAVGGSAPYSFAVSAGALPGGLNLSSGGVLSGTPLAMGTFNFTVQATDANDCMGTRSYTVIVSGTGLMFYPLASPVRLLDTRPGASPTACSQADAPITGGTSRTQSARNFCGIPANAAAITGNITTVQSGGGYLTLYPSGATQPTVASTNYNANEVINNVFTVGLGAGDGAFNIFALNATDVVVDVTGYYAPPATGGLYFHPLPSPVRLLETRAGQPVGCVLPGAPLAGGQDSLQTAVNACTGIPAAARAIVGNATTVSPQGGGYLTLFPADATRPLVASSNYNFNQVVNGPFTVGLSASGQFKIFTLATTDLIVDVLGYYSTEASDANGVGLLFTPLAHPVRLLETRAAPPNLTGCFKPNAPLNGAQVYTQSARGLCDGVTVPATALGVVGNATVITPLGGGFLTMWPSSATQPTVATANYGAGQVANRHFILGLGNADGAFKMFSLATTDLVIDLSGYFAP